LAKKTKLAAKKKSISKNTKLLEVIVDAMQDKKAEEIVSLDLSETTDAACDIFVICHASVGVQVKTIAEHIIDKVEKELGIKAYHKEGLNNLEWVLIDYIDIVVHVFLKPRREFYQIEDLWADATKTHHN
jgi:ribosome-associated protein